MTLALFTPLDRVYLQSLRAPTAEETHAQGPTVPNPTVPEVERAAEEVERVLVFYDLLDDPDGSLVAGQLLRAFHVWSDRIVSALREGTPEARARARRLLDAAVATVRAYEPLRQREESRLSNKLRDAVMRNPKTAGVLELAREHGARALEAWGSLDADVKRPMRDLLRDYVQTLDRSTNDAQTERTARFVTLPVDVADETMETLGGLAQHDHALAQLLTDATLACAEVRSPTLLHRLHRFPSVRKTHPFDYVRITLPDATLLVLPSGWVVGPRATLDDLARGTIPAHTKAASTMRTPLRPTWTLRADTKDGEPTVMPSISTSYPDTPDNNVLRCTFTSNAMRDPVFLQKMKALGAQSVGGCTFDIPLHGQQTPAYVQLYLKQQFGYPAKVIELLTGLDGESPPYYNPMSKYATGVSPLWSLQIGSDQPHLSVRTTDAGSVHHVTDGRRAQALLFVANSEKGAKMWGSAMLEAHARISRLKNWEPFSAKQKALLARTVGTEGAKGMIAQHRVAGHLFVLHPKDFVRLGSRAIYQPQIGEQIAVGNRTGTVSKVHPLEKGTLAWLTCEGPHGVFHVSRPDALNRVALWSEGDQVVTDGTQCMVLPVCLTTPAETMQEAVPVVSQPVPLQWDSLIPCGALRAFEPRPEEVGEYLPMDGNVALDGRYVTLMEMQNRSVQTGKPPQWIANAISKVFRPLTPPADPLTMLIEESGMNNPMFQVPVDQDSMEPDPDVSSSEEQGMAPAPSVAPETQNPGNTPQTRSSPTIQTMTHQDTKNNAPVPKLAAADAPRDLYADFEPTAPPVNPYTAHRKGEIS